VVTLAAAVVASLWTMNHSNIK